MPTSKLVFSLPFDLGKWEWTPDTKEREAAWALYVEFCTRITRVRRSLGPEGDFGSARLAMDSLYTLMNATRQVLRDAGATIAKKETSVGPVTINILNHSVRCILDDYHTKLEAHESTRKASEERIKHERKWPLYQQFWEEMIVMQAGLDEYVNVLEKVAGIKRSKK
jgi:hypothetical protein